MRVELRLKITFIAILIPLFAGCPAPKSETEKPPVVSGKEECPNYLYETLIGVWQGEQYVKSDDTWNRWVNSRNADGTYRIDFTITNEKKIITAYEEGLWAYSRCLYSVIVQTVDGEPVVYQEVYRVNEINDSYMDYTNYRTGNNFRIFRK